MNSGGLIQVADELEGFSFERAEQRASGIFETTQAVFELARSDAVTPAEAADRLAERRMRDVGRLRGLYLPPLTPDAPVASKLAAARCGTPLRLRRIGVSASVAGRLGVVRPLVGGIVHRLVGSVAVGLAVQLAGQCPEVRLVSAVLQVAGDLRLLGFSSAAPHRVDPLALWAGARGKTPWHRSDRSCRRGGNATQWVAVPAHPIPKYAGSSRDGPDRGRRRHQPGC